MAAANVLSLSNSIPIQEVYSTPLLLFLVSPQCQIATQDEDHDWQSGKLRRPVTHLPISVSEGYFLLASPLFLLLLLHHPPPSLNPLLLSSQWTGNLASLTVIHHSRNLPAHRKSKEKRQDTSKQTLAPPKGSLACLLTPVEWVVLSGSRRETLCSHTSSRRSWERTSHAFPFCADATGAVDQCLPGGHAALSCSMGPLRCV